MAWTEPVTNHADGEAYGYEDLNRVGNDLQYLSDLLNGYGYAVTVSPKTDWVRSDIPTATQMAAYLTDLTAIKAAFYGTTALPTAMDDLDEDGANKIETLLLEVETNISRMVAGFRKCGTFRSGQGVRLP